MSSEEPLYPQAPLTSQKQKQKSIHSEIAKSLTFCTSSSKASDPHSPQPRSSALLALVSQLDNQQTTRPTQGAANLPCVRLLFKTANLYMGFNMGSE